MSGFQPPPVKRGITRVAKFSRFWEPYHDGIGAVPRAQPNRLVVFRNGDGWFIYNLTRNLASNLAAP